jgi:lactoylglutathione lyase
MRYLHTMVRITDIDASLDFYCNKLGLVEVRRHENEKGRFTLIFLAAPKDKGTSAASRAPELELTFNWDPEVYTGGRNFGHLAYKVDNIYETCQRLMDKGVTINRPPRDGNMAFVRSPDNISIELLQEGDPLPPAEPARPTTASTSSRLSAERAIRNWLVLCASAIGRAVKLRYLSCVSSMTKIVSENTMQAAVSSENCGFLVPPTAS